MLDPKGATADAVDEVIRDRAGGGDDAREALRRGVWGVGTAGAALVVDESLRTGSSAGAVLLRHLQALETGAERPVVEAPGAPWTLVDGGTFDPAEVRLLPWAPETPRAGCGVFDAGSAAATAAAFHEPHEAWLLLAGRLAGLATILRAERKRCVEGARRAREGVAGFGDPAEHARRAEALLAGLAVAERDGDRVSVPDPYAPESARIVIEAPRGVALTRVASDLYAKQKRARRGIESGTARAERLETRIVELDALLALHGRTRRPDGAAGLEAAMRGAGLSVGLARSKRAAREAAASGAAALAGVRMIESSDGWTILVGRTGKDNDRLTFKLAAAEDLWLHAHGVPGAHVVVRTTGKSGPVPERTLQEAARLAAWFSDARGNVLADVQWTERKHVRRARGAGAGTVLVKRSRTIRVRPTPPAHGDG